ncbi:MAG TPA: hypothetical protein VEK57_31050 [Thermoanaerobaculia bacterium]|nr:hypothetical protein [Thermoanaerobaculia bacterium]
MTEGDSTFTSSSSFRGAPPADRELVRRLLIVTAFLFVFAAAFAVLERTYSRKFYDITGRAQWIWPAHRMSDNYPVAFFATRDFDLPERRIFTHLKVMGDPEYTVYLNGQEIGGRRIDQDERSLDFYDVSALAKTGRNRIVVAVRAPRGVGGLIAAIDIAPEQANWIVTNSAWRIYREWSPEILIRDSPRVYSQGPLIIGEPPIGRWNYLALNPRPLSPPPASVLAARESFEQFGFIPTIRTRSGVAVAGTERARATVFDFGFTRGRVRLTTGAKQDASKIINVRLANHRDELARAEWSLRPVVFAPGENVATMPESYSFRYVMVFGWKEMTAEVVN